MRLPRDILSYEEITHRAEKFLSDHGRDKHFPIDIDRIVEIDLDIEVVPTPYLHERCGVDGFITPDCSAIYIEMNCWLPTSNRGRFTLAHEASHAILHREALATLAGKWSKDDGYALYETIQSQIDPEDLSWIEWQARSFGGVLLLPTAPLLERIGIEKAKYTDKNFPPGLVSEVVAGGVAEYFRVSVDCLTTRCSQAKIVL